MISFSNVKHFGYCLAWAVGMAIGLPFAALAAPLVVVAKICKGLCEWADYKISVSSTELPSAEGGND